MVNRKASVWRPALSVDPLQRRRRDFTGHVVADFTQRAKACFDRLFALSPCDKRYFWTRLHGPLSGSRVKFPWGISAPWVTDLNHALTLSTPSFPSAVADGWCASARVHITVGRRSGHAPAAPNEEVGLCSKTSSVTMSKP